MYDPDAAPPVPILDLATFRATRRDMTPEEYDDLAGVPPGSGPADRRSGLLVYLDRFWISRTPKGYRLALWSEIVEVEADTLRDLESVLYDFAVEEGVVRAAS